jgi:SpoVK/Ycf46/Vps4 family AAA+-type ATPase
MTPAARRTNLGAESDMIVQLARLALQGRRQDIEAYVQRLIRRYRTTAPPTADALKDLLRSGGAADSPLRSVSAPAPVDSDSRVPLLRLDVDRDFRDPILSERAMDQLEQIRDERLRSSELEAAGLLPSRTVLLTGPPGVGKTLSARWLANELAHPFLVLDLSAVMSSFLGRTGANLRRVLDYAKRESCVLLLDELDSIAKHRNDDTEVGELKRLVTVLIQEIDDWPNSSLLLAATNHPELLDRAIWRRFDHVITLELPSVGQLVTAIHVFASPNIVDPEIAAALAVSSTGASFSDLEREILNIRRRAALHGLDFASAMMEQVKRSARELPPKERRELAATLASSGELSQRKISDITGVSRDTIRSRLASEKDS